MYSTLSTAPPPPLYGTYHYTVHTGTKLNAKGVIRINGVGFSFQTLLFLQAPEYFSAAVWSWRSALLGACWQLVSVSKRVRGPPSSPPFPLTSLLAPLVLFVSVYKLYTLRQLVRGERRDKCMGTFFFFFFFNFSSHASPLLCQQGEAL